MASGRVGAAVQTTPEEFDAGIDAISGRKGYPTIWSGLKDVYGPGNEPGQTTRGATKILKGAGTAATPLMVAGAIAQPELALFAGVGSVAGGAGAKKIAQLVNASPDTQDLVEQVGQLGGGMIGGGAYAGAKALSNPENALTDLLWKRGYIRDAKGDPISVGSEAEARAVAQEMLKQNPAGIVGSAQRRGAFTRAASDLPQVSPSEAGRRAAGQAQSQETAAAPEEAQRSPQQTYADYVVSQQQQQPPRAPQLPGAVDATATKISEYGVVQQRAQRVAQGLPPVDLPPPAPPPKIPALAPEDIHSIAQSIEQAPPAERPQAILDAHEKLSALLLQQGKMVVNGKLEVIKSPDQADSAAQRIINTKIADMDKQAEAAQKEAEKPAAKSSEPSTGVKANSRQKAADLAQLKFEVSEPAAPKFEVVEPSSKVESKSEIQRPLESGAAAVSNAADSSRPSGTAALPELASVEGAGDHPPGGTQGAVPAVADTGSKNAPSPLTFQKGDPVTFSKGLQVRKGEGKSEIIPVGTKAFIEHANPGINFARVRLTDGKVHSVPLRNLEAGHGEGATDRGRAAEISTQRAGGDSGSAAGTGGVASRPAEAVSEPGAAAAAKEGAGITSVAKEAAPPVAPAKSDWQQAFDKAVAAQPERESEFRKMSGEQLRSAIAGEPSNLRPSRHEAETMDQAIVGALHSFEGADSRWDKLRKTGADDATLKAALMEELGQGGFTTKIGLAETRGLEVSHKTAEGKEIVKGSALVNAARRLLQIPQPGPLERKTSEVLPGKVGEMKVSDLKVAPAKFQYKLSTDAEGVGTLLKETKVFNPDLAGVISVWRDPADGKMYVVNGHHRYELAKRTGQKTVTVRHIIAKDATTARAIGALQNIAEGRGTAIDAAKFFHDSGLTPEQLKEKGISLGEKTASDGLAMSRLDPQILAKVINGDLRQGMAVAIGEGTADHAQQAAILKQVDRMERKGQKVSDSRVREFIRLANQTEKRVEETTSLFGTEQVERSLLWEKSAVSEYVQDQLKKDKKLFGFVAKSDRAAELERGGNKIDVEKSKEISTGAAQAEEVYNLLSARAGPIATILDEAARKLADGENAAAVKSEAYSRIRAEVSKTLGGGQGGSSERSGGTSESGPDTGTPLFSPETELAPPFYSKAARVAFDKLPSSASGESMLATLRNAGVKADELKWIGLDSFLGDKPKATKAEVLSYIMRNMVQVREVAKADTADAAKVQELQRQRNDLIIELDHHGYGLDQVINGYDVQEEGQNDWYEADRETGVPKEVPDHIAKKIEQVMALDKSIRESSSMRAGTGSRTKYSSYTLAGEKKNYTELLLTLPQKAGTAPPLLDKLPEGYEIGTDSSKRETGGLYHVLPPGQVHARPFAGSHPTEKQAHDAALKVLNSNRYYEWEAENERNKFTTSHFDEPNIVAHVRFDERTDADGKPILFVEEVQSDWHQKGKKVGYRDSSPGTNHALAKEKAETAWQDLKPLLGKADNLGYDHLGSLRTDIANGDISSDNMREESPELRNAMDRYHDAFQAMVKVNRTSSGVPNAPFKSDWHELAMKTMLRKAAEGGYDKIGWVTGEQTADRYDISKQIESLNYDPDNQRLVAKLPSGSRHIDKQVPPEQLPDYIGKEAAQRLLAAEKNGAGNHELRGTGLKVGGEWAKALYDRAIPNFLSKYGKKWGAKVGDIALPGDTGKWEVKSETGWESTATPGPQKAQTVHGLTVTPEMRASVLSEGQPLFSAATGPILSSIAAKIDFDVKPTTKDLPPYLELNAEATEAISRALGVRVKGVNLDARMVPEIVTKLKAEADRLESRGLARKGAVNLRELANAMLQNTSKDFGLSIVRGDENKAEQLATLHEEMLHSGQRAAGGGDLEKGTPWKQLVGDRGMTKMAEDRIVPNLMANGIKPSAAVVVAEGLVDIMRGDAWEISDRDAYYTAQNYFESMAARHGIESVERLQDIENFIAQEAEKLGVNYGRPSVREAGRQALRSVLSGKTGTRFQPIGERAPGKSEGTARSGTPVGVSEGIPGQGLVRSSSANAGRALASTQTIGLTDEELADWSKAKGFRVEPAGEQLDIFGANEPVMRVFRAGRGGKEQAGLVYQRQLDQLNNPKEQPAEPFSLTGGEGREEQPALFGAGDLGEIIGSGKKDSGIKLPEKPDRGTSLFKPEKEEKQGPEKGTSEYFLKQFEADPDGMVDRYLERNTTPDGQIAISADRARSLFSEYAASKEGAARYTVATNKAASATASAAFDRVIQSGELKGKEAVFVAGGPGAGKSTAQNAFADQASQVKLWYEGNLSDPALLQRRVQAVMDAGGHATVVYVYAPPKVALERMIKRAGEIGRYVPIEYGSKVAANTPPSIDKLYEKYGDAVRYDVVDNSGDLKSVKFARGIDAMRKLTHNLSSDAIRDEQLAHAKSLVKSGELSPDLYDRIAGGAGQVPGGTGAGNQGEHREEASSSLTEKPPSLLKDESGSLEPGKVVHGIANAAGHVGDLLRQEIADNRRAKELQWDMYDLDKRHEARVLRAKQLLESLQKDGVTQEDRRAIDEHLDALQADSEHVPIPSLTAKQDEILDTVLMPMKAEAEAAFKKVTGAGMTIPNYNPRQTKGKSGMLDRFLTPQGEKRTGRGNLMSTNNPAAKHRVMMAIEREGVKPRENLFGTVPAGKPKPRSGKIFGELPDRVVVSLKGGQVTAWDKGTPENLGPILHSEEGGRFVDKDGSIWTLKQATKKEIEAQTNLEYYHDAAASTIVNWLQAKKAEAAHDLMEKWKAAPSFSEWAMPTDAGNPPKGWRTTNLPQMKGYYVEPHMAEDFDWFFDRLKSGSPNAFDSINAYMRMKILLNPIKHPLNVGAQWAVQKGVTGFLPNRWIKIGRTGARAINAIWNQNEDAIEALDAGAPLQSFHSATRDLVKVFYDQMADAAEKGEPWATKLAKSVGLAPVELVKALHTLSSKIAWPVSDMMFLQSAYEYQADHAGTSLHDALREVGRIIPEYRLPTRIMDSPALAKVMASNIATVFGSYHYGLLRSFSESAKSAMGAGEPAAGRSRAQEVGKGWDRLALMALGAFAIYGVADELAKKLTGNKDATVSRHGIFSLLQAVHDVARKEAAPSQLLTKVVTPNPALQGFVQVGFNRDLSTGRKLYDPSADWSTKGSQLLAYLKQELIPEGQQIERAKHSDDGWKKFLWNHAEVDFPKHGAEKIAQEIASTKMDTSAWTPQERERYYARQEALDGLRKGDSAAFEKGLEGGSIRSDEINALLRRSQGSPLYDRVHGFTYAETERVFNAAVADKDENAQEQLLPLLLEKQSHLMSQGRFAEAGVQ